MSPNMPAVGSPRRISGGSVSLSLLPFFISSAEVWPWGAWAGGKAGMLTFDDLSLSSLPFVRARSSLPFSTRIPSTRAPLLEGCTLLASMEGNGIQYLVASELLAWVWL